MGGSILIVEDELVTQRLIAASLERAGYKVTRAPSAAQAEVAIREVIPDLVLLDWILPGTTGVAFLRQLRDRKSTRLNSSHGYISYAVFCLKKKKTPRSQLSRD